MRRSRRTAEPVVRSVAWTAAAFAVGAIVLVLVVCSRQDWRDRLVLNVVPTGPVATLAGGDRAETCAEVGRLPDGAERAAFDVRAAGAGASVRAVVRGPGAREVRGPATPVTGSGTVRPSLGGAAGGAAGRTVCLQHVGGPAVAVQGSSGLPALRLTGDRPETLWSVLPAVVERSSRATGAPARWLGLPGALVLLAGAVGLALRTAVRTWSSDVAAGSRRVLVGVAAVALLHGAAWAVVTPPFEVPDEWSHLHYAEYVADHGTLPNGLARGVVVAPDQAAAMDLVGASGIPGNPSLRPPWSADADALIRERLAATPDAPVPDGGTSSTGQPPVYYAAAAAVDRVAPGNVLDRLAQVRLVGVLAFGLLAAGVVALARRLAPRRPAWAVTAGLLAALAPLVGFLAGGVTPDVLLVALAVWTTWAAVRFAERPTARGGVLLGVLGVLLALVKLTGLALGPGLVLLVVLGLAAAVRRGWPRGSTAAVLGLAAGVLVPLVAYVVWCVASDRSMIPGVLIAAARSETGGPDSTANAPLQFLSLSWQLWLPRLPSMDDLAPGFPLRDVWLEGLVGRFGWLDHGLPRGVGDVLVAVWAVVVVLALRGVWLQVRRLRALGRGDRVRRATVGVAVLLLLLGTMVFVARADFLGLVQGSDRFLQARYLLPALPFAVLVLLLGLSGTPGRWRPVLAVGLVGIGCLHVVASILATAGRWYV